MPTLLCFLSVFILLKMVMMFSKIKLQMSEIWMLKAVKTWTGFFYTPRMQISNGFSRIYVIDLETYTQTIYIY